MQAKLPEKINEHLSRTMVLDLNKDTDGSDVRIETVSQISFYATWVLGSIVYCLLFCCNNFLSI